MKQVRFLSVCLALLLAWQGHAQTQKPWLRPLENSRLSFYDIQQAFTKAYRKKGKKILKEYREAQEASRRRYKGKLIEREDGDEEAFFQFRRWEDDYLPRVYPSGDLSLPSTTWQRFSEYLAATPSAKVMYEGVARPNRVAGTARTATGAWTLAGPAGAPAGGGAGRINFVKADPANSHILYAGGPDSGLWKSTDGGAYWTTATDFLSVIGCSDLVFDPGNSQVMFLATGDGDGNHSYSTGVLKSTDGGQTWNATGLTFAVSQRRVLSKLLINPTNPSVIMAAGNTGIYRSTDGGVSWSHLKAGNYFTDLEFKPGDPSTVYAAGYYFYRSLDGGATWTTITAGLPAKSLTDRLAIAVTPANGSYVYLLATNIRYGFYGLYRSGDDGTSFATRSTGAAVNILGWEADGSDVDAVCQGYYDLALDASPTNAEEIMAGGINIWRSTTGGASWSLSAHWLGSGVPYVHADIHSIGYSNGSTCYVGSDGGVQKTTDNGANWLDISGDMGIAQVYRIGLSGSDAGLLLSGHQDNGMNLKKSTLYSQILSGDGMECFVDRTDNKVMYGALSYGWFHRSLDGGANWSSIAAGFNEQAEWIAPWCQDPVEPGTLWAGYENVWKSVDRGKSWARTATLPSEGTIVDLQVAPSDNRVAYAYQRHVQTYPYESHLYKTVNGGSAWTDITGSLPVNLALITRIAVKPSDPQTVWVCFSGYNSAVKVYKTTDGGATWTNISTGLPNLPVNCIKADPGSPGDALYVGCDVGVYYLDNTLPAWQPYFTNLPHSRVQDIEIFAPAGKIRVATFGRGVWETSLYPRALPLTLLSFSGKLTAQKAADLEWRTANEANVSHFEVEHSTDNVRFVPFGSPAAANGSVNSYRIRHLQTRNGSNYYRLKMVNSDGSFRFSNVVKLHVERSRFVAGVSPNPFSKGFTVMIESPLATRAALRLADNAGKLVVVKDVLLLPGVNEIVFDPAEAESSGLYLLSIEAADYRQVLKVVKAK